MEWANCVLDYILDKVPVTVKNQLWFLESIEKCLGVKNLAYLKQSPICHLFQIPFITLQGQLMVVVLPNIESSSKNCNTLSFGVNSRSIELVPEDFALIIGLQSGLLPHLDATRSDFHSSAFMSKRSIKFHKIHNKFLAECSSDGNSIEALKLALLYITTAKKLIDYD